MFKISVSTQTIFVGVISGESFNECHAELMSIFQNDSSGEVVLVIRHEPLVESEPSFLILSHLLIGI